MVEEEEAVYACEVCGKGFRNEGSLVQHRPIHRKFKLFSSPERFGLASML